MKDKILEVNITNPILIKTLENVYPFTEKTNRVSAILLSNFGALWKFCTFRFECVSTVSLRDFSKFEKQAKRSLLELSTAPALPCPALPTIAFHS